MHDRFEQEVQKKMEELNLTPSAPVWEKIEIEIRPEKKRRRVIFWLLFGLMLSSGAFFTYQIMEEEKPTIGSVPSRSFDSETTVVPPQKQNDPRTEEGKKTNKTITPEARTLEQSIPSKNTKASLVPTEKQAPVISKKRYVQVVSAKPGTLEQNIATGRPSLNKPAVTQSKEDIPEKVDVTISQEQKNGVEGEKPNLSTDTVASAAPKIINDSTIVPAEKQPAIVPAIADSSGKKKIASKKVWRKTINFSVGKSDYIAGPLLSFSPVNFDAFYQSPSTSGASAPPPVNRSPSEINSGLAFAAGFSFSKKMSDHFEVSVGLQYAHYSTTSKVGNIQQNSLVQLSNGAYLNASRIYSNGSNNKNTYTNRFHAVELPVTITWQPALNLPLYISAGMAYGQVLSTNAISFSAASNVYYPDQDSYVHQMLPVFSSVQVGLFEKKNVSIRIGPMLQYNAIKLKKTSSGDTPHMYFAGIKTGIIF
jgi:hypothetical protein